jgi:hypothetical protein
MQMILVCAIIPRRPAIKWPNPATINIAALKSGSYHPPSPRQLWLPFSFQDRFVSGHSRPGASNE